MPTTVAWNTGIPNKPLLDGFFAPDVASVPVDLEVPEFWFTVKADGDRHRKMFSEFCAGLGRRRVTTNLSIVPFGTHLAPRRPPNGGITISYHSVGSGPNIWRIKETPIVGWYSFDENGFSGWSSLALFPELHAEAIDAVNTEAARRRVKALVMALRAGNTSKYEQSGEAFDAGRPFVYFPMQLLEDPVAQFCRIDPLEVLRHAAAQADATGRLLVVKRHPQCTNSLVTRTLDEVQARHRNVMVSAASIHRHLEQCETVIVANSGVGLEALLYEKAVFTFASSEYELGGFPCGSLSDLDAAFTHRSQPEDGRAARFVSYYLDKCCFSIDDRQTIDRCIEKALLGRVRHVPPIFTGERDDLLKMHANVESLRRELSTAKSQLTAPNNRNATQAGSWRNAPAAQAVTSVATQGQGLEHDLAAQTAFVMHSAGLAASVGDNIMTKIARATFVEFAELAISLRADPDARRLVDSQLLQSGYAAGLDRNVAARNITAADYQRLHDGDAGYQNNNWLVDHAAVIASARPETLTEVGCGNGRFLRAIAGSVRNVIGLDWARSPLLGQLPSNVHFQSTNVLTDALPRADICCSADVLEHFTPDALPALIAKLHESARLNYHVIACYDDGHSHCAVLHPGQWLGLFKTVSATYEIAAIIPRRGRPDQLVCVITNVPNAANYFPYLGVVVGTWQTSSGQRVTFGNDFSVTIEGQIVASWFPMTDGRAAVGWMQSKMVDVLDPAEDGKALTITNMRGERHEVRRVF